MTTNKNTYKFDIDPFYIFDVITKNKAHHVKKDAIDHMKAMGSYDWQLREFRNPKNRYCDLTIDDGMYFKIFIERDFVYGTANFKVSLQFIDYAKNKMGDKTGLKPIFFSDTSQRFYIERMPSSKFFDMEKAQLRNNKLNLI